MAIDFFDFHHTVTDDEVDAQGHVHNLRYLQWTLWAARDHSAAAGWDAAHALKQGFGWVVREHEITYRAAALGGDDIVVRTWVSDLRRYASTRNYLIGRPADQALLCKASTRWVYIDLRRHQALEIPEEARAAITVCRDTPKFCF